MRDKSLLVVIVVSAVVVAVVLGFVGLAWRGRPTGITSAEIQAIASKMAPLVQARSAQVLGVGKPDRYGAKRSFTTSIVRTDVVRTDSTVDPVVGEIVLRNTYVMESEVYTAIRVDCDVLRIAKRDGRWRIVSHRQECERDENTHDVSSDAGKVREFDPASYQPDLDKAAAGM